MHFHRREFLASLLAVPAWTQEKTAAPAYPPQMDGAQVETYKTINGVKLNVWMRSANGHSGVWQGSRSRLEPCAPITALRV
jgi:hypothetical protein